jgi:hypothetical protein
MEVASTDKSDGTSRQLLPSPKIDRHLSARPVYLRPGTLEPEVRHQYLRMLNRESTTLNVGPLCRSYPVSAKH